MTNTKAQAHGGEGATGGGSEEERVSRANFLRQTWRSTLEAGAALVTGFLPAAWLEEEGGIWVKAGEAADFDRLRLTTVGGSYLALVNGGSGILAFHAQCPADGWPLQRELPGTELGCPFCGGRYDPVKGWGVDGEGVLERWQVKVEQGEVFVRAGKLSRPEEKGGRENDG